MKHASLDTLALRHDEKCRAEPTWNVNVSFGENVSGFIFGERTVEQKLQRLIIRENRKGCFERHCWFAHSRHGAMALDPDAGESLTGFSGVFFHPARILLREIEPATYLPE